MTLPTGHDPKALAIADAVAFLETIGPARKEARLRFLAHRLPDRLGKIEGLRFLTVPDPQMSAALATFAIERVEPATITRTLRGAASGRGPQFRSPFPFFRCPRCFCYAPGPSRRTHQ
jgi:selenocysteine lyase/cysteine desulfurase